MKIISFICLIVTIIVISIMNLEESERCPASISLTAAFNPLSILVISSPLTKTFVPWPIILVRYYTITVS